MQRSLVVCLLAAAALASTSARAEEPKISIVVEQGHVVPAQVLDSVGTGAEGILANFLSPDDARALMKGNAAFEIRGGARFADGGTERTRAIVKQGVLSLPRIQAADAPGESFLRLVLNGRPAGPSLRVATQPPGAIQKILGFVPAEDEAYLALGEHFAIVDERIFQSRAGGEGTRVPRQSEAGGVETQALCFRTPFGPGWVEWQWIDPWTYGYSVLPESSTTLIYGRRPSQDCDGLYNLAWGCGWAWKVPDSCTSYEGDAGCCCNAAMAALGHVCRWVNPGSGPEAGWPFCPLP